MYVLAEVLRAREATEADGTVCGGSNHPQHHHGHRVSPGRQEV